jgi:hypothetical protein|tara:strand:+ start:2429 stop:3136 length:708 start_codon:yes stop_codon:yes gene_type:complete
MKNFLKYSQPQFTEVFSADDNQVPWIPMDTLKLFKKNLKKFPTRMSHWVENPFEYTINKYGFRCPSFDDISDTPKLMTVGCSNTFGIGLPEHGIWPRMLADELNLELYNLAVPGGSSDSVYRTIKLWFDKIKPSLIVWFFADSTTSRSEKFDETCIHKFGPWKVDNWHLNEDYATWYNNKNLEAIKYLIKDTPIIVQTDWTTQDISNARDLQHRGFEDHQLLYKEILRKVKDNET